MKWSWQWDSNPQPELYKSPALPLSYTSESGAEGETRTHYILLTKQLFNRMNFVGKMVVRARVERAHGTNLVRSGI